MTIIEFKKAEFYFHCWLFAEKNMTVEQINNLSDDKYGLLVDEYNKKLRSLKNKER